MRTAFAGFTRQVKSHPKMATVTLAIFVTFVGIWVVGTHRQPFTETVTQPLGDTTVFTKPFSDDANNENTPPNSDAEVGQHASDLTENLPTQATNQDSTSVPTNDIEATQNETLTSLELSRPIEVLSEGYIGSDSCDECHTHQHASWSSSYHRTMTQVATPEIVLGDFNDVTIMNGGKQYRMSKENGVCKVDMPDEKHSSLRVHAPVVMTTGSHHMQVYWFATGQKRLLGMLPLIHLNESNEWIPRESAFLVPPHLPPSFELGRWNEACSSCHSTHRKERRLASGKWDTHVGEFGISCEACHGPAQQHVDLRRSIRDSVDASRSDGTEDTIVNPSTLSKELSAQVCGQCHSVFDLLHPDLDSMVNGHRYRPGMDLTETHGIWNRDTPEFEGTKETLGYDDIDTLLDETFYSDGMVRVSGREYNGLIRSSCYLNGEMTCLSCHKMHQSSSDPRPVKEWANDQLAVDSLGDQACTQCHTPSKYDSRHTHHAAGSSGSACYNCHMPHTTYGLLKAIRSHEISIPNVGKDHGAKRPNACNQCHLDKTLHWAADKLQDWYEIQPPELTEDERTVAASLLWLLKGNAAERAISAWCMGWDEAKSTAGDNWLLPFLAAALDDDYDAIRLISRRSIQSLPGRNDFQLDVVTSTTSAQRQEAAMKLVHSWLATWSLDQHRPTLLLNKTEGIDVNRIRQLIDQRDNSRILLSE